MTAASTRLRPKVYRPMTTSLGRFQMGTEQIVSRCRPLVTIPAGAELAALHDFAPLVQFDVDVLPVAVLGVVSRLALDHRGVGGQSALHVRGGWGPFLLDDDGARRQRASTPVSY